MPWPGSPRADLDYLHMYRMPSRSEKTLPLLVDGSFEPFRMWIGDVLAFWRMPLQISSKSSRAKPLSGICVLMKAAQMLKQCHVSGTSKHAGY